MIGKTTRLSLDHMLAVGALEQAIPWAASDAPRISGMSQAGKQLHQRSRFDHSPVRQQPGCAPSRPAQATIDLWPPHMGHQGGLLPAISHWQP